MRSSRALLPLLALALLAAEVAAYLAYEPQVIFLEVAPERVSVEPTHEQRLEATVRTALPDPFRSPGVSWTVEPQRLGSVGADAVFRAGPASGSGTITASAGGVAATIPVVVRCPERIVAAGIAFAVSCTSAADVYLEEALARAAVQTVLRSVDADVAQIEADYARPFTRRPLIYVFATKQSFGVGLREVLSDGGNLPGVAIEADGVYASARDVVGIDWEEAGKLEPFTTLRHELTHKMAFQIVARNAKALPAWLDEGSARLAETTLAGTEWIAARERAFAASMAATGTLFTLEDLTDATVWGTRIGPAADHQYHVASQAVRLMRDELGPSGIVRLLEELGGGKDFPTAYAGISGKELATFVAEFARRVRALAPSPGVVAAGDSPRGRGLTLVLHGWTPSTQVSLTLVSGRREGRTVDTVSEYGTALVVVAGDDLPSGTYTVTAVGANGRATTTARMPS